MKKLYLAFLLGVFPGWNALRAQINYSMTPSNPGYTALSGGTNIPDLSAGSDLTVTPPIPIGFNFDFDGVTYTDIQASDNGYIHLGSDLGSTGYGNAGGDEVIPNDFSDSSGSNPGTNTMRPFIAPLWEELAIANIGGNSSYLTSGTAPNRTFTIEWDKISWRAPTGTDQISFQVVLHETTNVIDFIYRADPVGLGVLPTASIGLAGMTSHDFYSLSDDGPNPVASKTINTTDIGTKPATGQMYTWTPGSPAGIQNIKPAAAALRVYCGQGSDHLTLSSNFTETGNLAVTISDVAGKTISSSSVQVETKGENSYKIAVPSCPPGIYIVRISGRNVLLQSKFSKD